MIYLIVLEVPEMQIKIGALGKIKFKGVYAYVGSAPSEARIKRHLKKEKKLRWHIDYLTSKKDVKVLGVFRINASREHEEKLAKFLENFFEFVPRFGCSDTKARSHLFKVELKKLEKVVKEYCGKNGLSFSFEPVCIAQQMLYPRNQFL